MCGQCSNSSPTSSSSTAYTPPARSTPAEGRPARTPPPPRPGTQWRQSIDVSPIDDSQNVYLRVSGTPIPNRYGGVETPSMVLRCKENTTAAIINWEVYLGIDARPITLRIDSQPALNQRWSISTNYESLGRWRGGSAIPFIKSLFGHEKLYALVTPYGESSVSTTFDISGLEDRIGPLREACNW